MATEIERKYLVRDTAFLAGLSGKTIVQGYIADAPMTTRVRIRADEHAFLTLKGPTTGLSRDEFEYAIPLEDARAMLERYCGDRVVRKTRYEVPVHGRTFEVDVFGDKLTGLVLAEVELDDELAEVVLPDWVGTEVSFDARFTNAALAHALQAPQDSLTLG